MASVNIMVKGIAMNYRKDDGLWHILFPWGDCHNVKFKESEQDPGIALAGENVRIKITTEGAVSQFNAGDNFNNFIDLTAEYSHSDGIKAKDGWEEKAVLMTVENAKFSVDRSTNIRHFMFLDDKVTLGPQEIGYDGKMEIEADKVIVEVEGHGEFPKTFSKDCTLIFDNDCGVFDARKSADFAMLYDVVEDINKPGEQFEMAKVTDEMKGSYAAGTVLSEEQVVTVRDSLARGLPCHMVRVSKTDGLP
jgi:hypothetical protein